MKETLSEELVIHHALKLIYNLLMPTPQTVTCTKNMP